MQKILTTTMVIAVLGLTGCSTILQEFGHPGGAPGEFLDDVTFDASHSKEVQLYRSAVLMAMVARMGSATVRNDEDVETFVRYLAATAEEINYAASNIYQHKNESDEMVSPCRVSLTAAGNEGCEGHYILLESDLPLIDRRLFRLALASLPEEQLEEFIDDASGGNIFGALINATKVFFRSTDGIRRGSGVYRSGVEGLVASFKIGSVNHATCFGDISYDEKTGTVYTARQCLGLSNRVTGGIHPNELRDDELPQVIGEQAFKAMFNIVQSVCASTPLGSSATSEQDIAARLETRKEMCGGMAFRPKPRPLKPS